MIEDLVKKLSGYENQLILLASLYENTHIDLGNAKSSYARLHIGLLKNPFLSESLDNDFDFVVEASKSISIDGIYVLSEYRKQIPIIYPNRSEIVLSNSSFLVKRHELTGEGYETSFNTQSGFKVVRKLIQSYIHLGDENARKSELKLFSVNGKHNSSNILNDLINQVLAK